MPLHDVQLFMFNSGINVTAGKEPISVVCESAVQLVALSQSIKQYGVLMHFNVAPVDSMALIVDSPKT